MCVRDDSSARLHVFEGRTPVPCSFWVFLLSLWKKAMPSWSVCQRHTLNWIKLSDALRYLCQAYHRGENLRPEASLSKKRPSGSSSHLDPHKKWDSPFSEHGQKFSCTFLVTRRVCANNSFNNYHRIIAFSKVEMTWSLRFRHLLKSYT